MSTIKSTASVARRQSARSRHRRLFCFCGLVGAAVIAQGLTAELARGYATGDGNGGKLSHQWITLQGWELYRSQFGASEIDNYLGAATTYPTEATALVMEGVFAEDEAARNPWGQGELVGFANHPSLRHFWTPNADFSRDFTKGLQVTTPGSIFPPIPSVTITYDSAANRAVKYFTGGRGVTGVLDPEWRGGQGTMNDFGIVQYYNVQSRRKDAYYYLGHVTHLLQDLTLPPHSQGDQHLEVGSGTGVNPDPIHDWVDGVDFSTLLPPLNNPTRIADFNDISPLRYQRWRFLPASGGVGRPENAGSILTGPLRAPADFLLAASNPSLNLPEIQASIPAGVLNSIRPLYYQLLEAASMSDDFDSRNAKGQVDAGNRGDLNSLIDLNNYDNWTREELDQVSDRIVPFAMRTTAELFRYFYSRVDPTPPELEVLGFAPTPELATIVPLGGLPASTVTVKFLGVDAVSGIDLDGFDVSLAKFNPQTSTWQQPLVQMDLPLPNGGPIGMAHFANLTPGLYRAKVANDNGGGLRGESPFAYFLAIPEPATAPLLATALVAALSCVRSQRFNRTRVSTTSVN